MAMSWARDEVLFRAQFGLLGLKAVHNRVFRERPEQSPEAVQRATLDLVRSLEDEGLAVLGDRTEQGFAEWDGPGGEVLESTRACYAAAVADPYVGGLDLPWLGLTDAGRRVAKSIPVDDIGEPSDDAVPQWHWPLADAARQVLVYGTIDWIELGQIDQRVKDVSPDESARVRQQRTLELIADLARGGFAEVGEFNAAAFGFVPWASSLDETLSRIRSVYVDAHDDTDTWEWYCILELTRKGELLAHAIEAQAPTA